jgi:uncharacterized SAM-binding protein YcdF (DUF218 family)
MAGPTVPAKKHGHAGRPLLFVLLAAALYFGVMLTRVVRQAHRDETRPADVIVVFGAAEYVGKPSPVYRARLDHAADLFKRGIAPVVIATGGAGGDPVHSEGEVGHDYLRSKGIPETNLVAEMQSEDTSQSAERVAVIMRKNGWHTCVAVSDGYHIFRIKRLLEKQGITVFGSPRPVTKPLPWGALLLAYSKEVVSYTAWRFGVS